MNQHINKGCGIRKTMSTKRAKMPQIRNPGKKALIIALVKLGLYKAPTLLLNEGIPRAYRGKKLRLKNILLFPSETNGK